MGPRVTIGMPVFNAETYLRETLDSYLAQTFTDFELIISDNASTDATETICRDYCNRDPRIRYFRNDKNLGGAANFNRVVHLARSQYFKWATYDDLVAPDLLRRCVETLDVTPEAILCYARTTLIDARGSLLGEYDDGMDLREPTPHARLRHFIWNWSLCNVHMGLVRLDALRRTRMFQPYIASDLTCVGELALLGQFREIPETLFFRRIHPRNSNRAPLSLVAQWFHPDARAPWIRPSTRVFFGLMGACLRTDLDPAERIRALGVTVLHWWARQARVRGGRLKAAVRRAITRSPQPPESAFVARRRFRSLSESYGDPTTLEPRPSYGEGMPLDPPTSVPAPSSPKAQ